MTDRIPFRVTPMLATLVKKPFHQPGWLYEEKYDGYRILAYKEGRRVTLVSRNENDRTETFAGVAKAVAGLPYETLLLDGEMVVCDRAGVSRFQLLQGLKSAPRYAVFDCLYKDGADLRRTSLTDRRAALELVVRSSFAQGATIFVSDILAANGLDAFAVARRRGFEGLVAKDGSSLYVEGRSRNWLKVKVHQEDEFIIVGYTAPEGARQHFGALLLGAYDEGKLRYAGKVGTGFNGESLSSLFAAFQPLVTKKSPLVDPPRDKDVTYLSPRLVAQIAYEELTADRKLRQPVFLGLRDDKSAREVTLPRTR